MKAIDRFTRYQHRYQVLAGKQLLGEVFVLSERFIHAPKKVRRGLRYIKVVGY